MRIGLSTAAYYGRLETEDAARKVASLGVSCAEVFLETYSEYRRDFGELVKARLGKTQAVSIHAKTQHFEGDFIGRSVRQRGDAFALLEGVLDAASALSATTYVYHGPANIGRGTPIFESWQEGIGEAIARCERRGIALSYETVSWCWLNSPERVGQFLRLWPGLSFVLDVKQCYEMGQDPLAFVDAMGDRLRHVHILDTDEKGRHALPGAGIHDFRDLSAALRQNGYQGDIILEPYAHVAMEDGAVLCALDYLGDVFHGP